MSKKSKLEQSRNKWKAKAIERSNMECYLRKENNRIKKERDKYKKELKEAKEESSKKISVIADKESIVYIVLQLFLIARIGFRAISRVLEVMGSYIGLEKTPSHQTIINWISRLSIARIQNANSLVTNQMSNNFICIIDTSIGLGTGKILAVLFLDTKHHILNKAPTLQDVNCVAVSVADSWTGETVANFLEKVIAIMGKPMAYLKDGGKELDKAVRLLDERGYSSSSLDDISHTIANLLKHEYQKHPMFETFISACGKISSKFKQSVLACLVPPKVSTKSRFMNLHRLIKWANQLLKHSPKGRAKNNSILSKLRANLEQMPECKVFIKSFLRDANSLLGCQKILKEKGLNQETYMECQPLIEIIPEYSPVRIGFTNWAQKQLSIAQKLGLEKVGIPISSDTIESLFGTAKQHGTGEVKDANRIALRIPTLCGKLTRQDAKNVLEITVKEQQQLVGSLPSLIKQRRIILPNPGCLDKILSEETKQHLELIPLSKNQSKNLSNTDIFPDCNNLNVPIIDLKIHTLLPGKTEILGVAA